MDLTQYDSKTKELIDLILKQQQEADPEIFNSLKRLRKIARAEQDESLMGFYYYRLADANYSQEISYSTFLENIRKAIFCFVRAEDAQMLARSYNFIAIDAANKGCYDIAYHYYMTGLRACESLESPYMRGIITSNIAQLYQNLGDYQRARRLFRKSARLTKASKDVKGDVYYYHNLINCYYGEGHVCILLQDLNGAQKCLDAIEHIIEENHGRPGLETAMIAVVFFRAQVAFLQGQKKLFKQRLKEVEEISKDTHQIFDFADDISSFCHFLLEQGITDTVNTILERMNERIVATGAIRLQRMVADLEVDYYERIHDEEKVLYYLKELHRLAKAQETEQNRIHLFSLELIDMMEKLRTEQEKVRKENEILQQQAMTDVLTGIPNRLAMNKILESAFERAYADRHTLGIEILDIDHFKEYNDTYGHQKGDTCLERVAREINQIASHPQIHCARYGGDEFVLIYENMRDEEVLGYARKLEKRIAALKIPHEASTMLQHVSISQGICNAVPNKKNKLWDFLTEADEALYSIKEQLRRGRSVDSVCMRTAIKPFG